MAKNNLGILATYKDLFDDQPLTLNEYLDQIPLNTFLDVVSMILQREKLFFNSKKQLFFLFHEWIPHAPDSFRINMLKNIRSAQAELQTDELYILSRISCLNLLQLLLTFDLNKKVDKKPGAESDIDLLKVFLLINEEYVGYNEPAKVEETDGTRKAKKLFVTHMLPQHEIEHLDLSRSIVAQTVKAIMLFNFLKSDPGLVPLLEEFLNEKGLSTSESYIKKILGFLGAKYRNPDRDEREYTRSITLTKSETYQEDVIFFDTLCSTKVDYSVQDFTALRTKPIIKISEGQYRILFYPFLIDKVFRSIYFDLVSCSQKVQVRYKDSRATNLKSLLGQEFTENYLLYDIMKEIIGERSYIHFPGEVLRKKYHIKGEPDYYIRSGNKVLLIECKDVLIKKEVKHSFDFELIEEELCKKFVENENGKPKALRQLLNFIEYIGNEKPSFDQRLRVNSTTFYPIIVIQDPCIEAAGINWFLQDIFDKEIASERYNKLRGYKIYPPVIINIDTLIYFQNLFKKKKPSLFEAIQKYIKYTRQKKWENSLNSFHYYLKYTLKLNNDNERPYSALIKKIF